MRSIVQVSVRVKKFKEGREDNDNVLSGRPNLEDIAKMWKSRSHNAKYSRLSAWKFGGKRDLDRRIVELILTENRNTKIVCSEIVARVLSDKRN
jgi:hypothetical protein